MLGKIRNVFVFKRKAARELLEANDTAMLQKFAGLATCLGEVSSDTKAVLEEENEKIVSLIRESPRRLDYVPDTVVTTQCSQYIRSLINHDRFTKAFISTWTKRCYRFLSHYST